MNEAMEWPFYPDVISEVDVEVQYALFAKKSDPEANGELDFENFCQFLHSMSLGIGLHFKKVVHIFRMYGAGPLLLPQGRFPLPGFLFGCSLGNLIICFMEWLTSRISGVDAVEGKRPNMPKTRRTQRYTPFLTQKFDDDSKSEEKKGGGANRMWDQIRPVPARHRKMMKIKAKLLKDIAHGVASFESSSMNLRSSLNSTLQRDMQSLGAGGARQASGLGSPSCHSIGSPAPPGPGKPLQRQQQQQQQPKEQSKEQQQQQHLYEEMSTPSVFRTKHRGPPPKLRAPYTSLRSHTFSPMRTRTADHIAIPITPGRTVTSLRQNGSISPGRRRTSGLLSTPFGSGIVEVRGGGANSLRPNTTPAKYGVFSGHLNSVGDAEGSSSGGGDKSANLFSSLTKSQKLGLDMFTKSAPAKKKKAENIRTLSPPGSHPFVPASTFAVASQPTANARVYLVPDLAAVEKKEMDLKEKSMHRMERKQEFESMVGNAPGPQFISVAVPVSSVCGRVRVICC